MTIDKPWDGHFLEAVVDLLPEDELRFVKVNKLGWERGGFYDWLVAIGTALKPRSILEIGVKLGCGGAALALGAASMGVKIERYFGVDGVYGIPEGYLDLAKKILGRWIGDVKVMRVNVNDLASIDGQWDLAFLDDGHTSPETRKQIELAASVTSTILVDDCLDPAVNAPVLAALQPGGLLAGWSREWIATVTGITLLRKP